ncbi:hypothetical protein ACVWW4_006654 [Bradyrhizobium sp. LB7.1]
MPESHHVILDCALTSFPFGDLLREFVGSREISFCLPSVRRFRALLHGKTPAIICSKDHRCGIGADLEEKIKKRPVARANVAALNGGEETAFENEPPHLDWHDAGKAGQEIREAAHSSTSLMRWRNQMVCIPSLPALRGEDGCHFMDMCIDPLKDLLGHDVSFWKNRPLVLHGHRSFGDGCHDGSFREAAAVREIAPALWS